MRWPLPDDYPRLYIEFLHYFNTERDYYECHEVLEELWLEEARNPLYQGLLQVAVALYHFSNENVNGAVKLFRSSLAKLHPFPDICLGINLAQLKRDVTEYLAQLEQYKHKPLQFYDLTIEINEPELQQLVKQIVIPERENKS